MKTSVTEKVVLKKKTLHFWISKKQKHWHLHMTNLFTRHKYISNCRWIKQSHLRKFSNEKLRAWILVNDGTLGNKADFASALDNVNNVKISDLLEFVIILLFSSICSPFTLLESCKLLKHPRGRFFYNKFKKSLAEVSFYVYLQLFKTILKCLLSYEVTLVRKCKNIARTSEIKISN